MERGTNLSETFAASPSEEVKDHLWGLRDEALYRARLSALYHRRREGFFDTIGKLTQATALFAGSSAFAMATDPGAVQIASTIVAGVTALSLVFGFSGKARRHAELAGQFKHIEAEIHSVGEYDYTEEQINGWRAEVSRIEASEPPALATLVGICQNRLARAGGHEDKIVPISWHRSLIAHFV